MYGRYLLIIASILLMGSSSVSGEDRQAGNTGPYVELQAGVAIPSDIEARSGGATTSFNYDAGFIVGGAVGYQLTDRFRAEFNLSYRQSDFDGLSDDSVTIVGASDVGILAGMVNGYFDFDLNGPITPYVGFGVGVGWINANLDSSAPGIGGAPGSLTINDSSTEFAWNVMGGVTFRLSDTLMLNCGYRYLLTQRPTLDGTARIPVGGVGIPVLIETPLSTTGSVVVHEVLLGARYEF